MKVRSTFKTRPKREGWAGPNSYIRPVEGDRLIAVNAHDTRVTFSHPMRIISIHAAGTETTYTLGDGTHLTVPQGARLIWEDQ